MPNRKGVTEVMHLSGEERLYEVSSAEATVMGEGGVRIPIAPSVAFFLRSATLHIWKAANSLAFESEYTITKLSICNTLVKEFQE